MNSTRWRESMTTVAPTNEASQGASRPDIPALLFKLQQSLNAGQCALLRRDLEKLEKETAVQASLSEALADSLRSWKPGDEMLCSACSRVMDLCRVQLGLLRRAQRSLRVLANLLAGPESSYVSVAGLLQPASVKNTVSRQEG